MQRRSPGRVALDLFILLLDLVVQFDDALGQLWAQVNIIIPHLGPTDLQQQSAAWLTLERRRGQQRNATGAVTNLSPFLVQLRQLLLVFDSHLSHFLL